MWKKNGGQGRQLNNNSNWNQDIKNSSIYHLKTIRSNIKIDAMVKCAAKKYEKKSSICKMNHI